MERDQLYRANLNIDNPAVSQPGEGASRHQPRERWQSGPSEDGRTSAESLDQRRPDGGGGEV